MGVSVRDGQQLRLVVNEGRRAGVEDIDVKRDGDNLLIELQDGTRVELQGYFKTSADLPCSLQIIDSTGQPAQGVRADAVMLSVDPAAASFQPAHNFFEASSDYLQTRSSSNQLGQDFAPPVSGTPIVGSQFDKHTAPVGAADYVSVFSLGDPD